MPSTSDVDYRRFEYELQRFIQREMPYRGISRESDEATDAASDLAKAHGPTLWEAMQPEAGK